MPRKSLRRRVLDSMQATVKKLRLDYFLREAFDDDDSLEDERMIRKTKELVKAMDSRYLFREKTYCKNKKKFDLEDALKEDSDNYNNEEFLYHFRITRDSFFLFLEEMKDKKAFVVTGKSSHQ